MAFCPDVPITHSPPTENCNGNIRGEGASHADHREISPNIETNYQKVQAAARAKLLKDLKDPSKSDDLQSLLEKALLDLRAAGDKVDPVTSETLQAVVIHRPSVHHNFEKLAKGNLEVRERKLQGEVKNFSMAQSKLTEEVAKPLNYACQPKDSSELIADRLEAPEKRLARNAVGNVLHLPPVSRRWLPMDTTGGNIFLAPPIL